MGATTKIDWADSTWNPVTGCFKNCEYCYAMSIVRRFGSSALFTEAYIREIEMPELLTPVYSYTKSGSAIRNPYPHGFLPTLHRYLLDKPQRWKKPRTIFVCSMGDLFGEWVPDSWIQAVFGACAAAPWHRYLFLTKNPSRYDDLKKKGIMPRGYNYWFGSTILANEVYWESEANNFFVSIEPIMSAISFSQTSLPPDWIIVGAMTGPQARRYPVKREWIESITDACKKHNIPLFMKNSLRELMSGDFVQEYPWK